MHDHLERLADALHKQGLPATVLTPQGRRPCVQAKSPQSSMLREDVYAESGWFWWSWADRLAPVTDVEAAARKIARVLGAVGAE